MPNYVTNILTIEAENVAEILDFVKSDESDFDFQAIVPMPECLKGTTKGSFGDSEKQAAHERRNAENMEQCGYENWYDWSCDHWGTKWSAIEPYIDGNIVNFDTAWSTPAPVFRTLSGLYPDAKFHVQYADEDIGHNCGSYTYQNGEVIDESHCPSYTRDSDDSDRIEWVHFALNIKDYDDEWKDEVLAHYQE